MLKKVDLDKPILMNDKLDAIWVQNELVPGKKEFSSKNNNYVEVQKKLKNIKKGRNAHNVQQAKAYEGIVEFIDHRKSDLVIGQSSSVVDHALAHEKEREFLDSLRIIISNGYVLQLMDIVDILGIINLYEIFIEKKEIVFQIRDLIIASLDLLFGKQHHDDHNLLID